MLDTAVTLLNEMLNKVTGALSFRAVFNRDPDITRFHPFGCRVLWHDFKNKLEPRAKEGIYISPAGGGHLILNPLSHRVITRRDARFYDREFPLTKITVLSIRSSHRRQAEAALHGDKAND